MRTSPPMITISLHVARAARTCHVLVGPGALEQFLADQGPGEAASFLAADEHVLGLHKNTLGHLAQLPCHPLIRGEAMKSFAHLEGLLGSLAEARLDRGSTLFAFGGGATGDLSGVAASLYMRGIDWVCAPTTLLAQVDASVGGKTAINLGAGKNLVGSFHQPKLVLADTNFLKTLDDSELRSGLGEVLKTALLGATVPGEDKLNLFELLEHADPAAITARDPGLFAKIVESCVRFKASIVEADERESGARKQLNLGHTFAHAIEHVAGYGTVPHGVAVAAGLGDALALSRDLGLLQDLSLLPRHAALAERLGLPQDTSALRKQSGLPLPPRAMADAMQRDKKSQAGQLHFVLPRALGDAAIDVQAAPPTASEPDSSE
ncbi:MAG: 3-dehydroquinate synthase [Planctomycetota bacterium]|nr:3-dehydroquinate synthase [Planctomycetota bacterium]